MGKPFGPTRHIPTVYAGQLVVDLPKDTFDTKLRLVSREPKLYRTGRWTSGSSSPTYKKRASMNKIT